MNTNIWVLLYSKYFENISIMLLIFEKWKITWVVVVAMLKEEETRGLKAKDEIIALMKVGSGWRGVHDD